MYIVTWETESGDSGVEGYWEDKPTDLHLETYFRKQNPDEFDHGRRLIWWEVHELEKAELPKPAKRVTPSI